MLGLKLNHVSKRGHCIFTGSALEMLMLMLILNSDWSWKCGIITVTIFQQRWTYMWFLIRCPETEFEKVHCQYVFIKENCNLIIVIFYHLNYTRWCSKSCNCFRRGYLWKQGVIKAKVERGASTTSRETCTHGCSKHQVRSYGGLTGG